MKKILIIGQAPSSVQQEVPYDTTMLYEILSWAGISKGQAREMFIFDACYDKFPGFTEKHNHKPPTADQFKEYLDRGLRERILNSDKILLLGKVAFNFLTKERELLERAFPRMLSLPHPSYRNAFRIRADQERITRMLKKFIES